MFVFYFADTKSPSGTSVVKKDNASEDAASLLAMAGNLDCYYAVVRSL